MTKKGNSSSKAGSPSGSGRGRGKNALTFKPAVAWSGLKPAELKKVDSLSRDYMAFLNAARTERETVRELVRIAEKEGFCSLADAKKVTPGDRLYLIHKDRSITFAVAGKRPLSEGANMVASHVDCPRLDLKMRPLYGDKDSQTALLRTHYYGGIRKYHWVNTPLELRGVIYTKDGKRKEVELDDVRFLVPDLLPHLGKSQNEKKLADAFTGEDLQVLAGSRPAKGKHDDPLAMNILEELNRRLGIGEEDLVSAELTLVPSWDARELGFDRSMIAAYGQDDRVNAFLSLVALLELKTPDMWAMAVCYDKEEVGSEGPGGAQTRMLSSTFGALMDLEDPNCPDRALRRGLERSRALSADVKSGVNPLFKSVQEFQNAAHIGRGPTLTKYTGARGKSAANDARAEFVGHVRGVLNRSKIPFQVSETGKVDEGGGGTVAKFLARENMDVVDIGVPLLSMHSPFEVSSKVDLHCTRRFFTAFFEDGSGLNLS